MRSLNEKVDKVKESFNQTINKITKNRVKIDAETETKNAHKIEMVSVSSFDKSYEDDSCSEI